MTFAGILLVGFLLIKNRKSLRVNRVQLLSILLLAIFSVYLTNILEFWGLQKLSAAKTCFIYSLSPFLTALFSYFHFNEKMTTRKWIGLSIGFLGFIPVLLLQTGSEGLFTAFGIFSWPELAVMGAAVFSVYGWVLLRIIVKKQEVSPIVANGGSMLVGGVLALITAFFVEGIMPIKAGAVSTVIAGIAIATFLSNIVCYNLYGYMLKRYTATLLSFFGLLSPIFASFTSWVILGESPSPLIFLSTSIVLLGLWIVYREELRQGYLAKAA